MAIYTLEYADGRTTDIVADDDTAAERAALDRFGDDAVAAENWDDYGTNDDGEPMKRLLIWESEAESIDDPGVNSVAYLTIIGRA
jgi:hypothetical protein